MSVVDMGRNHAGFGFGAALARLTATIAAWNEARVTRRELERLSDRELADIGLLRSDIASIS